MKKIKPTMYEETTSRSTSITKFHFGMISFVIALLYVVFLFPSPENNSYNKDDASLFMTLAINLAEYGRYTTDTFPVENYGHHATWPFVFPVLMSAIISIFGVSWIAIKFTMASLGLLNLYLLKRLWAGSIIGYWSVILTGLSPAYFLFSHVTMTEIPFMLACTATILALEKTQGAFGALGASLLAIIAFYTRGYAITFLPAATLFFLLKSTWSWKKRFTVIVCFALPFSIGIVAWSIYTTHIIEFYTLDDMTKTYGNSAGIFSNMMRPISEYAREFYWYNGRFTIHYFLPIFSVQAVLDNDTLGFLSIGLLGVVLLGWMISLRNRYSVITLWLPFAIGLLLVVSPSPRYWLTYIPFLFYFFLTAVSEIAKIFPRLSFLNLAIPSMLLLVAVIGLGQHFLNPDKLRFLSPYWKDYQSIAFWSKSNLPEGSVIVAHHPAIFYVSSNHRVYPIKKVDPSNWPPKELKNEPNVYVLRPNPSEPTIKPKNTIQGLDTLLQSGQFKKVKEEGFVSMYIDLTLNEKNSR